MPSQTLKHDTAPEDTATQPVIPAPTEPVYLDHTPVTVLFGYGTTPPTKTHWVADRQFKGGVGRNIPYSVARAWKEHGHKVMILPNDADEADFLRVAGVTPMPANRLAAQVMASDMDLLYQALGPERAAQLAEHLAKRLPRR